MISLTPKTIFAIGATVVALGYLAKREAAGTVKAVASAVNPVSNKNIFYRAVNSVGGALSGEGENFSLGTWFYDITRPAPANTTQSGMSQEELKSGGRSQ
jgi:hypothetical protein